MDTGFQCSGFREVRSFIGSGFRGTGFRGSVFGYMVSLFGVFQVRGFAYGVSGWEVWRFGVSGTRFRGSGFSIFGLGVLRIWVFNFQGFV